MQSRWICRCFLAVASAFTGCNRADPLPPTAVLAPVPGSESVQVKSVVVPVRHEVASDEPRVRIHLTMVEIHSRGPFPKELPDLWTSKETSSVFSTDEIQAAVVEAEKTGMARGRAWADLEVASGQTGDWDSNGGAIAGVTVTVTMGSDGLVQVSFVAPQDKPNTEQTIPNESKADLRENETLVVAGPTSHGYSTEISTYPYLGDIPVIGPLFFSAKKTTKVSNKALFLLSWEAIPK
ncbi:MAG: type and secretion system protein [Schlesneria sp.]|nr:type and secretion system protein [Schlesneria sp.]